MTDLQAIGVTTAARDRVALYCEIVRAKGPQNADMLVMLNCLECAVRTWDEILGLREETHVDVIIHIAAIRAADRVLKAIAAKLPMAAKSQA